MMMFHPADMQHHRFPEGWQPAAPECYIGDAEVWLLERV